MWRYPVSLGIEGGLMSENAASDPTHRSSASATIADVRRDVAPMGDLSGFVIDDLSPQEEDEFFAVLEGA